MATKSKSKPKWEAGEYEKFREERIKANRHRMDQLGLFHLSRHLHHPSSASPSPSPNPQKTTRRRVLTPADRDLPSRRSSRLQNSPSVDYTEARHKKARNLPKPDPVITIKQGSEEEFYTEEHDKLLGSCEMPWNLDKCTKDNTRIYDQVSGKSCHQCRQKTTGYRTSCSKCQLVQGQFCGNCLYMRYGENVLEAMKNTEWICPVCRGICNCSQCRIKKGWNPTGPIYKKVVNLGYESVAHYLIQTRRKAASSDQAPSSETEVAMSGSTEATKENEPNPEIMIMEKADESNAASDEETMRKCPPRFKRKKKETCPGSISPNPVAARLRRRHYGI